MISKNDCASGFNNVQDRIQLFFKKSGAKLYMLVIAPLDTCKHIYS